MTRAATPTHLGSRPPASTVLSPSAPLRFEVRAGSPARSRKRCRRPALSSLTRPWTLAKLARLWAAGRLPGANATHSDTRRHRLHRKPPRVRPDPTRLPDARVHATPRAQPASARDSGVRARRNRRAFPGCSGSGPFGLRRRHQPGGDSEPSRLELSRRHVALPEKVVHACREQGVARLLHMCALRANGAGPSEYLATKAEGERASCAAQATS